MRFRLKFVMFSMVAALSLAVEAKAATVLPDACGSDKIKFDVSTTKLSASDTIAPVEGKARIVFVETVINSGFLFGGGPHFTTRFGVDGKWVGAANNNSYFVIDFDPGKHHLCSAVQGTFSAPKDKIGMMTFTAEAGKVYYLSYTIRNTYSGGLGTIVQGHNSPLAPADTPPPSPTFVPGTARIDSANGLGFLDEDEAAFRIKSSKVSKSKPSGDTP